MSKIAVMDSGFGGLTVLSALRSLLPNEEYIYYGDSANAPYGDKSPDELLRLNREVCRRLLELDDIKCFVIACNTTTSEALDKLEGEFSGYDFVGIEPAVGWAVNELPGGNILVLATNATINGKRLRERAERLKAKAHISLLAAPGIVPYVEGGQRNEEAFREYLHRLTAEYQRDTDAVVLGCTHFPFVKKELRGCFDKDIRFYDAAALVAERVKALLTEKNSLNNEGSAGGIIFLNSDESKIDTEKELLMRYSVSEA